MKLLGRATVDECRKKWRDMRDVYVREKREEKKRKTSGSAASLKKPWRYSQVMSFLLPFITSRATSTNMEEERRDDGGRTQPTKRYRRADNKSLSTFEKKLLGAVEAASAPSQQPTPSMSADPDRLFLESLLPALKELDPQRKARTKLKIHQLIFEAQYNYSCDD
ncbi:hypothetical protein SKAU_G00245410 [Synaphobranchus kaupii]|uniref:BESS domain-containing protein n=1 Tax=Synaphobranchus kaupii TaxID=118154 RepID=A0A9Q1F1U9_SYNKA|nr:hypothetical protein SKAU_G00245410 [Synaphobranchus kaupii]